MSCEEYVVRRMKRGIAEQDDFRREVNRLVGRFGPAADEGIIPREYIDALHNCLDVTEKEHRQ